MKKSEIADLIGIARGFDDRIEEVAAPWWDEAAQRWVEDARLSAWHLILSELDFELAVRGLTELYRAPQMMRLQPGHVYEAAEKVRARNVSSADLSQLTPPDQLETADGRTLHAEWMQAAMRGIGLGLPVREAQDRADAEVGASRRALGPAQPRPLQAALRSLERGGTA